MKNKKTINNKIHEWHARSLVKTITYRVLIIITNGAIVYYLTESWEFTYNIMAYSAIISTIVYYIHERIWNRIHWGRVHHHQK